MRKFLVTLALVAFTSCGGHLDSISPLSYQAAQEKHRPEVLKEVEQLVEKQKNAVVIFDLDDTLFDAGSRGLIIFKEFAKLPEVKKVYPNLESLLATKTRFDLKYKPEDTLKLFRVEDSGIIDLAKKFFNQKFFLN